MAYHGLTVHLLISAPGDVTHDDMQIVQRAINQWNFSVGRRFVPSPVTVIPVSWTANAYSVFGARPQETLNEQLVDLSDLALVMFADKLGFPTGEADSGTVEELDRMLEAGKPVSVVRSTAPRTITGVAATEEKLRLEHWLQQAMSDRAGLVSTYTDSVTLASLVTNLLSGQAERFLNTTRQPAAGASNTPGVWPRVEVVDQVAVNDDGKARTTRAWKIILENRGTRTAHDVRFRFETADGELSPHFDNRHDRESLHILPPGEAQEFPLRVSFHQVGQAICVVYWTDEDGAHESRRSVHTF